MRTAQEIVELIDRMFPRRVYVLRDEDIDPDNTPMDKMYLVQFYQNPTMTLMTSIYGSTAEEATAKGVAMYAKFLANHCKPDNRKARPKYPDTPEGRLEEVVDRLIETFSLFMSEITSEELDT